MKKIIISLFMLSSIITASHATFQEFQNSGLYFGDDSLVDGQFYAANQLYEVTHTQTEYGFDEDGNYYSYEVNNYREAEKFTSHNVGSFNVYKHNGEVYIVDGYMQAHQPNKVSDAIEFYTNGDNDIFVDHNNGGTFQVITKSKSDVKINGTKYSIQLSNDESFITVNNDQVYYIDRNEDNSEAMDLFPVQTVDPTSEHFNINDESGSTKIVDETYYVLDYSNGDTYTIDNQEYEVVDNQIQEVVEVLEVQGPVQPANVKKKSKADKLVDGITDTWKNINSLDDICHAGNIYLETPDVNGFSLQYKNERCEEYIGVKFKWQF